MYRTLLLLLFSLLISSNSFAKEIPKGYLIFQGVATYGINKYGAISTLKEAEKIFSNIKTDKVGVEYESLYFNDRDIGIHYNIAKFAHKYNIDLWASSHN